MTATDTAAPASPITPVTEKFQVAARAASKAAHEEAQVAIQPLLEQLQQKQEPFSSQLPKHLTALKAIKHTDRLAGYVRGLKAMIKNQPIEGSQKELANQIVDTYVATYSTKMGLSNPLEENHHPSGFPISETLMAKPQQDAWYKKSDAYRHAGEAITLAIRTIMLRGEDAFAGQVLDYVHTMTSSDNSDQFYGSVSAMRDIAHSPALTSVQQQELRMVADTYAETYAKEIGIQDPLQAVAR